MASWDPAQYLKFGDHRLRPALDLLARVPAASPRLVVDLGCGTGNITALLAERWPKARVVGVDNAPAMLAKAKADVPGLAWVEADIGRWSPPEPVDVLFTNATLQWLPDHRVLFPRLVAALAPGGVFACQIPRNYDSPAYRLRDAVAAEGPWASALAGLEGLPAVLTPEAYHRLLVGHVGALDIWEAEYLHVLSGERLATSHPVVEWVKGTALRPYLDALAEPLRGRFLAAYTARVAEHYPPEADGTTLMPFRRLFIVARR
jgi:trans-aconitate 2-methyltransferase